MAYVINKIKAGSTTYNIASTAYATCTTLASTAAKVAYISGTSATSGVTLTTGLTIHVKFTYTNTAANPTLSVNGTTAKAIKCYGTTAAGTTTDTSWFAGETVTLTYDGSYWQLNRNIINLSSLVTYLNTLEQTARDLGILDSSGTGTTPGGGSSPGGGSTTFGGGWIAVSQLSDLQEGDIIVITANVENVIYALSNSGGTNSQQAIQLEPPVDGVLSENFDLCSEAEIRLIVHFDEDGNIYFECYGGEGQYLYSASSSYLAWTIDSESATRWILEMTSDGIVLIQMFTNTSRYLACSGSVWKVYTMSGSGTTYIQQNYITIYKWVEADEPV